MSNFFKRFYSIITLGFYYNFLFISRGFYFIFYSFFKLFHFIFRFNFINKLAYWFKRKGEDPFNYISIVFILFVGIFCYTFFYPHNEIVYVDNKINSDIDSEVTTNVEENIVDNTEDNYEDIFNTNEDFNLFNKYGKYSISDISISDLKNVNSDIVGWLMVDGTNINYPIVQGDDNEYYLSHDINKKYKISGWVFVDYRNDINNLDNNTIFYGHNLLNKTNFGSISNIFTKKWFDSSNHQIMFITENYIYIYAIFSNYYINPEVYYLQNEFNDDTSYLDFLNILKSRSLNDYNVDVSSDDKIITLSTCTDDNTGRKVVHAKLVSKIKN